MTIDGLEREARRVLGDDAVDSSADTLRRYGDHRLPGPDRRPALVVYPGSSDEVRTLVQLARERGVKLHPISTGENRGMGTRAAVREGYVTVDLGRRMNRILELDETLNYVVVEPGVTYRQLHDELVRRGDRLMLDTTSGPPDGGPLGNTLDKGAGYTPAADHFGNSCGFEVVLGDGRVVRTGDGALAGAKTWHLSKYGLGPALDGLFLQSNMGIVTKMGIWLLQRPPVIRAFGFSFPDDDDLAEIIELVRPLKLSGVVPTAIKVTSDLYAIGTRMTYPVDRAGGVKPLPVTLRKELQAEHGVGAWVVTGAVYGPDEGAAAAQVARVRAHFERSEKATYLAHETIAADPKLRIHLDTYSGRPTDEELGIQDWRGGGLASFTPATPLIGAIAAEHQALSRRLLAEHGFDFVVEYICAGRLSRALHMVLFDPGDPDERARAEACCDTLREAFGDLGWPFARLPLHMQEAEMRRRPEFLDVCNSIKRVLDPDSVLAPGRYGIG